MCDINFKSKLKRRKTFVENQQGTQSPREAPNGNPTWRNADGEESEKIPESRARGGPQAGRGESKAGTGPQGWAPLIQLHSLTSINPAVFWESRNPDPHQPFPARFSRIPRSGRNLQIAETRLASCYRTETGFLKKALWVGIFSF